VVICLERGALFAYGPADATAITKPHHLLTHLNPDWFYLSGTGLPRLSWKRPLNGCCCCCCCRTVSTVQRRVMNLQGGEVFYADYDIRLLGFSYEI